MTITLAAGDVLDRKLVLPEYCAVRLYLPTASDAVDTVATPEEFKAAVPRTALPFRKVTVPVCMAAPFACTVAVRISAWPMMTAFGEAARLVTVASASGVTITVTSADLLDRELALPAYSAVRRYVPAARDLMDSVAAPEEFRVPVPRRVAPFMKLTVPLGAVIPLPFTAADRTRG